MPRKVSLAEARDHLTSLVRDVERGQRVDLTRRGERVAVLVSAEEYDRLKKARLTDPRSLWKAVEAWRAQHPDAEGFTDEEVRSWRDRSPGRPVNFG